MSEWRLSRRELLGVAAAALACPAPALAKAKKGTVIGPGFYVDEETHQKKSFALSLIDLDAKKLVRREIPLDFFAHGVTPNPVKPKTAVLFEKKGPGACEVDLRAGTVLRKITTSADRRFYGHGAFSADGSVLYAAESVVNDNYKGVITVRDAKTMEVKGLFPTYGAAPHDCRLIDGKVLAITNGGGDFNGGSLPNVTYVEVASEKLLDKIEFSTPRINAGHLALTKAGDLAIVSAPRDGLPDQAKERGAVTLRRAGSAQAVTMTEPADVTARMIGETLSVAIHEKTSVVAATNPTGHIVTFWDLASGKLIKYLDYPHPRGVALTLDQKSFLISYAPESKLIEVDAAKLVANEKSVFEPTFMSGSHIITYDLPA